MLEKRAGLSANEIAQRSGISVHNVRVSIGAMITRFGGVVRIGKRGHEIIYGLPGRDDVKPMKALREHVAGPRYLPVITAPLVRDPFAHRDLALAGR